MNTEDGGKDKEKKTEDVARLQGRGHSKGRLASGTPTGPEAKKKPSHPSGANPWKETRENHNAKQLKGQGRPRTDTVRNRKSASCLAPTRGTQEPQNV